MQKLIFLCIVLLSVNLLCPAQDTLRHTLGDCLSDTLKSTKNVACDSGIFFHYENDTLEIYGTIKANCCGTHFAIIEVNIDTIYISTIDTGELCYCTCLFCFDIRIPASVTDTIVVINGILYNTKMGNTIISRFNEMNKQINIYPNPASKTVVLEINPFISTIDQIEIINIVGKVVRTINWKGERKIMIDISLWEQGVYFINIKVNNKNYITKKLLVK